MSTHIGAQPGDIAERVLMPGDPLRAKWIAETYLEDAKCYSQVRGMFGFTGKWQGVDVSVQGSGMGMPSASIYAHELINDYGVKTLIRVGSCGALTEDLQLRDVIAASGCATDSNMNRMRFDGLIDYAPVADFGLLRTAVEVAERRGIPMRVGPILAADAFYTDRPDLYDALADYGVLAVEMESAALYTIAARYRARALTILTVSRPHQDGRAHDLGGARADVRARWSRSPWTPRSPEIHERTIITTGRSYSAVRSAA